MDKRAVWDILILFIGVCFLIYALKSFSLQKVLRSFLIKVVSLFAVVCGLILFFGLNAYDLHWVEQHYEGVGIVILFVGLFEVFLLRRALQRKSKVL